MVILVADGTHVESGQLQRVVEGHHVDGPDAKPRRIAIGELSGRGREHDASAEAALHVGGIRQRRGVGPLRHDDRVVGGLAHDIADVELRVSFVALTEEVAAIGRGRHERRDQACREREPPDAAPRTATRSAIRSKATPIAIAAHHSVKR